MKLVDRFALLELERDDGIRTFRARETATGRDVQVHLLPHTDPRNAGLLGKLARSPDFVQRQILDRGYHEGIPYVVTLPLAHRMTFREWMTAMDRISASSASLEKQFAGLFERRSEEPLPGRRGQWKVAVPKDMNQTPATGTTATATAPARTATLEAAAINVNAGGLSRTLAAPVTTAPALEYPRLPLLTRDQMSEDSNAATVGPMVSSPAVSGSLTALARATAEMRLQGVPTVDPPESRQAASPLKSGTKSALALVLGVAAALAFLALAAAFWAFRPH